MEVLTRASLTGFLPRLLRDGRRLPSRRPQRGLPPGHQPSVASGRVRLKVVVEDDADLVFIGMAQPSSASSFTEYYARLTEGIDDLPTVVLVLAAPGTPFGEILVQRDVTMHPGS